MAAKRAGKASTKPTKPAGKTTTKATTTTTKATKATATTTTTGTGTGTEEDGDEDGNGNGNGNGEDEDAGEGEGEESREEDEQMGVDAGDERVPGAFVPRDAVVVRNILREMVRASRSSANATSFTKENVRLLARSIALERVRLTEICDRARFLVAGRDGRGTKSHLARDGVHAQVRERGARGIDGGGETRESHRSHRG